MNKLLSVIIPCRSEHPNLIHTIYSILHCIEADGINPAQVEVICVDNCSQDWQDPKFDWSKPGARGTTSYLMPRGGYYSGQIRVIYDPIAGNHSARNTGAKIAQGKYLYFSDAHVALRPGYFKSILATVDKYGGLVFGSLQTMGAYPPADSSMGFQYTWKLGDECRQTWANYKLADKPWYIIGQGAWGMACTKSYFDSIRGYEHYHRTYGGEFYLTSKAWMLGGTVMVDPVTNKKMMKEPWEYVNLGTLLNPQYVVAPYQMFLYGEGKEVRNLELKESQVVYEKPLNSIKFLNDMYFQKSSAKSGIVV